MDKVRDDLWKNHSQIHIIDCDFSDGHICNRGETGNDIRMAIPGWANVHPLLKVIPVEWEHYIPYGLLHSPQPSKTVVRFLAAAKAAASK